MQRVVELDDCTAHMKNKSDLEHAQFTRGPDSGPRNRILPDLVSSYPFPSLLPLFLALEPPKRDLGTRSKILIEHVFAVTGDIPGELHCSYDNTRLKLSNQIAEKNIAPFFVRGEKLVTVMRSQM